MMYVIPPETLWNHFLREVFSLETALYVLGSVALFCVIILVLEFLDSTKVDEE